MKTFLQITLLLIVSVLIQQALPGWPIFNNLKPSLIGALLVHVAFRLPARSVWQFALTSAVIYDSLEPGPYGPALLAFPMITYLTLRFRHDLFGNGVITQLFCGGIAGLIIVSTAAGMYLVTNARPLDSLFSSLIGGLLIGALLQPILSQLLQKSGWISQTGSWS
jgi:rod shape-determining protein MreD